MVSATGYPKPLYAKIHLLNMITAMEMDIHTATKKYARAHSRAMLRSLLSSASLTVGPDASSP